MRYFAKLDENDVVVDIRCAGSNFEEILEYRGEDLTKWIETDKTGAIKKNPATIGCKYDKTKKAFHGYKPFDSWVLDDTTLKYKAPKTMPTDGKVYEWDEPNQTWVEWIAGVTNDGQ